MNGLILKMKVWFIVNILTKIWQFLDGIKIKIAKSQKELNEIFHFRWKIYSKLGYIDLKDFPDQKLKDEYEESSLNIMALKDNILAGTVRLVLPSSKGFPTEKAFNIINFNFPKEKMGEISKLCIKKEYKNNCRKKIFLALMAEVYKLSKKNKTSYWLIGIPLFLKEHFNKLNFYLPFQPLEIGPLKPENIEERKTAKKYFEKHQIIPFFITLKF
jgi:hypothetical protein